MRAQIHRIDSYSAHADRDELHGWTQVRGNIGGSLCQSHGENSALEGLRALVQGDDPTASVIAPQIGKGFALPAGGPAPLETGRVNLNQLAGDDWQNDYADFITNLKRNLSSIRTARARREALERYAPRARQYNAFKQERKARNGADSRRLAT